MPTCRTSHRTIEFLAQSAQNGQVLPCSSPYRRQYSTVAWRHHLRWTDLPTLLGEHPILWRSTNNFLLLDPRHLDYAWPSDEKAHYKDDLLSRRSEIQSSVYQCLSMKHPLHTHHRTHWKRQVGKWSPMFQNPVLLNNFCHLWYSNQWKLHWPVRRQVKSTRKVDVSHHNTSFHPCTWSHLFFQTKELSPHHHSC